MDNKLLELGIEKNVDLREQQITIGYKWVTEPNACKKCKELDGKIFNSKEEFEAARPHPHCKCSYEVIQENPEEINAGETELKELQSEPEPSEYNADIEYLKILNEMGVYSEQQIKAQEEITQKINELEVKNLQLQNKIEKTLPVLEKEVNELKTLENNKNISSNNECKEIEEFRNDLKLSIKTLSKTLIKLIDIGSGLKQLKQDINITIDISKVISAYIKYQNDSETRQKIIEDITLKYVNKPITLIGGYYHSKKNEQFEAYNMLKIALNSDDYNKSYIEQNGVLYDRIEDYTNKNVYEKFRIRDRVSAESVNPNNLKVMVFNPDSTLIEKIKTSKSLEKYIRENIKSLRIFGIPNSYKIEFEAVDSDLYAAIHGAEVTNVHIDKEGNLYLIIEDLYNFNEGRTSFKGRIGRKLQEEGVLEPYYVVCPIIISKEELKKF